MDMEKIEAYIKRHHLKGQAAQDMRDLAKEESKPKQSSTLEWLMKDDNAFNMGRFAFITERDDVIAGKVIWDRVLKMTTDQDEAWSNFVDGWNAAMNEFKGDL